MKKLTILSRSNYKMDLSVMPKIKFGTYCQFESSVDAYSDVEDYVKYKLNHTVLISPAQNYYNEIEFEDYLTIKHYEKKHDQTSKHMFDDWLDGRVYGTDYTEWVTSYMAIKDKIYASSND